MQGEHKQRTEVPSLTVAVADQVIRLPRTFEDDPEYEDVSVPTGATQGRPTGLGRDEKMV